LYIAKAGRTLAIIERGKNQGEWSAATDPGKINMENKRERDCGGEWKPSLKTKQIKTFQKHQKKKGGGDRKNEQKKFVNEREHLRRVQLEC